MNKILVACPHCAKGTHIRTACIEVDTLAVCPYCEQFFQVEIKVKISKRMLHVRAEKT